VKTFEVLQISALPWPAGDSALGYGRLAMPKALTLRSHVRRWVRNQAWRRRKGVCENPMYLHFDFCHWARLVSRGTV
jgi:hypothetical protein